jgi:hypothetical protein
MTSLTQGLSNLGLFLPTFNGSLAPPWPVHAA